MQDRSQDLEISVDISADRTPRLRFSVAGQSTNVSLELEGAGKLAGSLLTSCFICSIGQDIPEGTQVSAGQIPVTASSAYCDPETKLPTLTLALMGGGELTLVFSADLAAEAAAALGREAVVAAQNNEHEAD